MRVGRSHPLARARNARACAFAGSRSCARTMAQGCSTARRPACIVAVVEAVADWRRRGGASAPFLWQGGEYLLKMYLVSLPSPLPLLHPPPFNPPPNLPTALRAARLAARQPHSVTSHWLLLPTPTPPLLRRPGLSRSRLAGIDAGRVCSSLRPLHALTHTRRRRQVVFRGHGGEAARAPRQRAGGMEYAACASHLRWRGARAARAPLPSRRSDISPACARQPALPLLTPLAASQAGLISSWHPLICSCRRVLSPPRNHGRNGHRRPRARRWMIGGSAGPIDDRKRERAGA